MKKLIIACVIALIAVVYISCNYVWYSSWGFINVNEEYIDYELPVDFRIKRLKNLKTLELKTDENSDLGFLSGFHELERLSLFSVGGASGYGCSLETLPEMPSVKHFAMFFYMNENLDGESIARLENAESVYLGICNVCDYSFVSEMKNLKELMIAHYEPSSFVPYEESMQVEYGEFDWSGLAYSESLEYFSADAIEYDPELFEALEKIPTLNRVHLNPFGAKNGSREWEASCEWAEKMSEKGVTVYLNDSEFKSTDESQQGKD